jgi:hypothetical protein
MAAERLAQGHPLCSGQELPRAGKTILEDAEDYCDRAHRELEKQQTSYHSLPRKITQSSANAAASASTDGSEAEATAFARKQARKFKTASRYG